MNWGSADLAIGDFKKNKLTIENKGGFPVPVRLKILYTDGYEKLITYKADVWKNGNPSLELEIEKGSISKFILD